MINEISKNLNKTVIITLTNGREKSGTIVSIDIESNTVRLRDENNNSIPILLSMIGMLEPLNCDNQLNSKIQTDAETIVHVKSNENFNAKFVNETKNIINQPIFSEILHKLIKIETVFDAEIKNIRLQPKKPDFETPKDILDADVYSRNDGLKIWNWIIDKYNYALKNGRLAPNSDELKAIIDKTNTFFQISRLSNSCVLYSYLGYFNYLNNDNAESIKAYARSAKLCDKPEYWLMLASAASEKEEKEMACYALEKFFLQSDCTKTEYEKAWYKFTELIIKYSSYKSFRSIINNTFRVLLKEELKKIFETICYCLIKNSQRQIAKTQIQNSLNTYDYRKLSLDSLEVLPVYPTSGYDTFKHNFEQLSLKQEVVKDNKSVNTGTYKQKKSFSKKSTDPLREARTARDAEKNYVKAEELFIQGIEKEKDSNTKERAVRDLASMLAQQMNQPEKAIQTIKKYQPKLSEPDLNLLYNFYYQSCKYENAIKIQKDLLKHTNRKDARLTRYFNIAACYWKLGNYKEAEKYYRNALNLNPTHYTIKRNIALCLYKQEKIDEAKSILERLVREFNDSRSTELLNNIENKTVIQIDDIIIDTARLVLENIDNFTLFYLSACDWKYVDKNRLTEDGKYIGNDKDKNYDIRKIEATADKLERRIAEERSNLYLNAARILFDLEEFNTNDFYIYMCKCFTSKGDNAVESGNSPDTVKTFYLAALKVYDSLYLDENRQKKSEFADAIKSLCRFIYSFLGRDKIPLTAVNIKSTLETVFNQHPDSDKIFDALCLLFAKSPQYSIIRVLKVLYNDEQLKKLSFDYLKTDTNLSYDIFLEKWKTKARKIIKNEDELSEQLSILGNFEISEVWLHSGIERINKVIGQIIFESDKNYLIDLQELFDLCISLYKINSLDEKINKCDDIDQKAVNFISKIEKNPTKLSIEIIYPIIKNVISIVESYLDNLYQTSKPELIINSAISSYHLKDNHQTDLQIRIENTAEGHAEQVELIIDKNNDLYELINPQAVAYGTIRGNTHETQIILLQLKPEAVSSKAFTLKVFAKFRTRQGEEIESLSKEIPIQLGDEKDFKEIKPNPYAQWVRGKAVVDKSMFFGRDEFIERAYSAICSNYKSYVIYGQYRSGKSSILHHLEEKLKTNPQIMVSKVGDVSRLMDDNSPTPLLYQLLLSILRELHKSIRLKERKGFPLFDFDIPNSQEFYGHPAPLDFFYELLDNFNEKRNNYPEWKDIRVVVTMDEFTSLYEKIVQGKLSQDFMKNWKALLAENFFNVVLVAQDVFPKFRNQYDNAFQTMEHERVTYLDELDAKSLIDQPIKVKINGKIESRYTEKEAIDRICELTACSPYYIQIFCNQLVDYINNEKQPYITKANVNIVKDRLLRGDRRLDKTAFTNLINNGDPSLDAMPHRDLIKVLKNIAENTKNDPYCIRSKINCETHSELPEILKDLEERDVIEKHGEKGFRIRVGLFKEWLNENPGFLE
ncbi:Tetratricopeptide repeat-containing protein [Desulfonema limicola]|uniref:Tetratricopeptide repeat-containing protein n=1 Tax=Desulfonema limicola TaxID=45656 RepID=A0A975GGY8_9BACT|nr:tetratricopeptide repeat protein [Desulfonema limicola]QTA80876.1 Tetratricopeptide repeat-containing protein [Desulfonema limicola]